MSRTMIRALALAMIAGSVAACNDSTAPEPVSLDDVLADAAAVESYAASAASAGGAPLLPSQTGPAGACTFTAASQSFVCPPVTHGGMTMTRSFQLLDASNTPQSAFNPATTAAVRAIIDMTGTITHNGFTADVLHHGEQTVGGLLSSTRTIDGESTSRFITTSSLGTDTTNTRTTTDLTVPRPTSATQRVYPSGTVVTEMTHSRMPDAVMTMTMTFNGTSTATLTMNMAGFTRTCTINLDERSQPPVCS